MIETFDSIRITTDGFLPDALLTTKLYIPPPRPGSVSRPRLMERLNTSLQHRPGGVVISAPPGFGKSTLLSEWVRQIEQANPLVSAVGWVSLDAADNRPRRFLAYCLAALQKIQPELGQDALARLSDHTLTPATFLTPLINEMMNISRPFVFVLDDYHVIEMPLIHQALAFVLDNLPPQGHLVIASRTHLPFSLARLRARGQLTELTATDLAFTPTETAEFLNKTMALKLTSHEIEALEARTEGWIAGLQMAALSMQGIQDTTTFVRAFTGSHRYVLDYLLEEVLNRQSQPIQHFLLYTSILNRLTAPLCDTLLTKPPPDNQPPPPQPSDDPNPSSPIPNPQSSTSNLQPPIINYQLPPSQTILDQLNQANLFIIPLDDERRWYRYHHLFADLLRDRLSQQIDSDELADLHRRASDWYRTHGPTTEAMSHALAALDTQRIVTLVREKAVTLVSQGEFMAMLSWLEHLPPEMTRSWSRIPLLPVWAMVLTGQLDSVEPRLRELEQQFNFDDDPTPVSGEITAIRAFVAYFRRDMAQAIELCRRAITQLPVSNPFLRGILVQSLGAALAWGGYSNQAADAFVEAANVNRGVKNWEAMLMAEWSLASTQAEQGYLKRAIDTHRQTLGLITSTPDVELPHRPPYLGRIQLGLAEIFYQQNRLSEAQQYLDSGLDALSQSHDRDLIATGHLILARLKQAQGDYDGARQAIRQAETSARQHPGPFYWAKQIAAYHATLWLAEGNVNAVQSWLEALELWPVTEPEVIPYLREPEYLLLVRFLLTNHQPPSDSHQPAPHPHLGPATKVLLLILTNAQANGRTSRVIELLLLQALLHNAQDETDTALTLLEQALSLAVPEEYVRVFVDEGQPMVRLLRQLTTTDSSTPHRAYIHKLIAATQPQENTPTPLLDPLSERELEILRLTATGMSNKQLAETLVLTVGTVKWHLNNIYSKLGVSSRTKAVARARELGVL